MGERTTPTTPPYIYLVFATITKGIKYFLKYLSSQKAGVAPCEKKLKGHKMSNLIITLSISIGMLLQLIVAVLIIKHIHKEDE